MIILPPGVRPTPVTGPPGASRPLDWRLQLIGGYLPPLMAGAALALARWAFKLTA